MAKFIVHAKELFYHIFSKNMIKLLFVISLSWIILHNTINAQPLTDGSNKFLGAATGSEIFRYFNDYWNQMTPGNAGKWGSVEYARGQYSWTYLDKLYNFCQSRDLLFKEHTLVWGSQQPSWISSMDSASQREAIEDWFRLLGERYPNMKLVDVVNEPLHSPPSYKNALGGDGETGWDWVISSFELARQYMPDSAKLILNEYNILGNSTNTSNYLEIINLLKERNLIDGVGIQGHYFEFRSGLDETSNVYVYSISTIKSNLDRIAETEIPIYITEFDIDEPNDQNQLEQYKIYFPIFWEHKAVKGITFWGFIEGDVWSTHPDTYLLLADGTERPALTWMRNYIKLPKIPTLLEPSLNTTTNRNPILSWSESLSADKYNLQVSPNRNFSQLVIDTVLVDTIFSIDSLEANTRYYWKVSAANGFGSSEFSSFSYFSTNDIILGLCDNYEIKNELVLYQNYPNPFNPVTTISFSLTQNGNVNISLFDELGRKITKIIDGYYIKGNHSIKFDGSNLASGMYFYMMKAENSIRTKKIIILK
ncbi:MAG: endo-1,4-beta-xylanase [Bacteroidetes bacterium]|nr:endo-1,4-beta-xylanase [Bacteroidota bacterium]MBU1115204.1 endo-1,4-beta-xylanase [Bacteroidota bacterium]MBU1797223.1 endo-1,4-beta-xylanase [Bacteroidota bacterium]